MLLKLGTEKLIQAVFRTSDFRLHHFAECLALPDKILPGQASAVGTFQLPEGSLFAGWVEKSSSPHPPPVIIQVRAKNGPYLFRTSLHKASQAGNAI